MYIYYSCFIHSYVNGHLGCFQVQTIVNSATVNIGIYVSFSVLVSSGYMPGTQIAGSYGGFIPSILRSLHTIFHSGTIDLHSHQQGKRVSFSPPPSPAFIVCRLFDSTHSDQRELVPHCGFDLHFSDNE